MFRTTFLTKKKNNNDKYDNKKRKHEIVKFEAKFLKNDDGL